MHDNYHILGKLPIGGNPTTSCPIHLKISGQIDLDLINNLSKFALHAWFQSYEPKSTFYPYVLFLAMAAILVGCLGHPTHF